MTRQILKRLTTLGLVVTFTLLTAVAPAAAQVSGVIRIKIPFDFSVRDKALPAGEYVVRRVFSSNTTALLISGVNNSASIMSMTHHVVADAPADQGKFVFHKYGDEYFLAQIWSAGETDGNEFAASVHERRLRQQLPPPAVQNKMPGEVTHPETVDIFAGSL